LSISLTKKTYKYKNILFPKPNAYVNVICYCIMPDHYHLLVKNNIASSFYKFINDFENSYTRYFNMKTKRKGPLWESSFKAVNITTNEHLLHISRYIHLNPTSSNLVLIPEDWHFSSYKDIITKKNCSTEFLKHISINNIDKYWQFVFNNIGYQKRLKEIRNLLIDR